MACDIPRGIAVDRNSGHIFVADQSNRRIVEFTARGQFVKMWGWDVIASNPGTGFEICVPADGDVCQAGTTGSGAGQFGSPQGVAVDSAGDIYVVDRGLPSNERVQKFDSAGNFLRMWGKGVNSGTSGNPNLCTNAGPPSDVCVAGSEGVGPGEFGAWPIVGSFIAIDGADRVYVGDQDRIQRFDVEGAYEAEISLPGETVQSLAVDAPGNLYVAYVGKADVRKITAGVELSSPRFEVQGPSAVTVDFVGHVFAFGPTTVGGGFSADPIFEFEANGSLVANFGKGEFSGSTGLAANLCPGGVAPGNLYVSNASSGNAFVRAYGPEPTTCGKAIIDEASNITETSARLNGKANPGGEAVTECRFEYGATLAYGQVAPCAESSGEIGEGSEPVPVHADIGGLTKGTVYHVRLVVGTAAGSEPGSDETFKTLGPPVISAEGASKVVYTEATLKALVNPEGFATKYHFEYGQADCASSLCVSTSAIAIGKAGDRSEYPVQANLKGLEPGTTYHWRVVADNSSGPAVGSDHVFTTYVRPVPPSCPNQAFRAGPGASLPDCRAYEMVSPIDKNGGDILHTLGNIAAFSGGGYVQTSSDGEKITYSTGAAFGDVSASLPINQYVAGREAGVSWSNHSIHPPVGNGRALPGTEFGLSREFEGFSPDLCSAWFQDNLTPPLTPEGQPGFTNIYRLGLCEEGTDSQEAVTSVPPPPGTAVQYLNVFNRAIAGYSDDARHALFTADAALVQGAAPNAKAQVYDHFGGGLHLVSVLPNGNADPLVDAVGNGLTFNVDNAVSADGSRVYWTSFPEGADVNGRGRIFLREHPEQGKIEGECGDAAKACTILVGGNPAVGVFFWAAAADGSGALYGEEKEGGEKLFVQEIEPADGVKKLSELKPARREVAEHVLGVLGASDDLSRVYFVSTDVLAGGAKAGEPNLYLDEAGTKTYVATLSAGDIQDGTTGAALAYNVIADEPFRRAARVSPDGAHITFESRAALTGFDNTDLESGEPLVEVFTYEAGGELNCVSCNPSGARPSGQELQQPYMRIDSGATDVLASAWIPTWEHPLYASHVLSDDGHRLFFHSYEALVPADTNSAMDVYEWEASGAGSCTAQSAEFHASNGGCLYLISSGTSAFESEFWDASADGRDVFFTTESSLLEQDPGLVDLYDARAGGGLPAPPPPPAVCEGEACQSPPAAPQFPKPASNSYDGQPNPKPGTKNQKCPKGKHRVIRKGKKRCVRPHKSRRRAGRNRRAGR